MDKEGASVGLTAASKGVVVVRELSDDLIKLGSDKISRPLRV